ncbi:G-alpha-domain-containing protein [Coniophora puteana RWD-64-598 SS2]|uniref:G-alpha-domain-containing protein n=1 Tax=Coniophora puteana (strain RWD-64-598) TaxID=741705 RepID=R7SHE1_CONPW|nr:G-alpha-domain-containing protein [Coniophora puteana RWD-64-598 SS2]EIW74489.1 G-alpha-domain-containing protein [Coniophora puteana RWD-64-598 SS2]
MIDEALREEGSAMRQREKALKILLLGQSESGKSTTLKNFRRLFARDQWEKERLAWRTVIQLNIVRAINTILDTLADEFLENPPPTPTRSVRSRSDDSHTSKDSLRSQASPTTDKLQLLRRRLGPLRGVEDDLKKMLGPSEAQERSPSTPLSYLSTRDRAEFYVRSGNWRDTLQVPGASARFGQGNRASRGNLRGGQPGAGTATEAHETDSATEVLVGCKDDMKTLWKDEAVWEILTRREVKFEDSADYFISNADRIVTRGYEPSDEDVLRARLRTMGVQEYHMTSEGESLPTNNIVDPNPLPPADGYSWLLYDVGGARTQRSAWQPFFEGVHAIIFLAPVSCFDERLEEDIRFNKLEDSFVLWGGICKSKLLANTTLVLFLNKCDLLEAKIANGAKVKRFLPSFGDRPNTTDAVIKYLKQKFKDTMKQNSPERRTLYIYPTSVVDAEETTITLNTVRDSILRENLQNADFV